MQSFFHKHKNIDWVSLPFLEDANFLKLGVAVDGVPGLLLTFVLSYDAFNDPNA